MEIIGTDAAGVQGVKYLDASGREQQVACDAVALGYHLRPETQLADLARCVFRFDEPTRQWLPQIDELGRSSEAGVYLAGDGVRVLGADGAELAGRLAAYAALADFGHTIGASTLDDLKRQQEKMDRFRLGLVEAFPWPAAQAARLSDDTVVCRCEGITVGELRRVTLDEGACEANRAKAFSRVGMGRCQGRYCGHAAAEIIADAAGVPVEMAGCADKHPSSRFRSLPLRRSNEPLASRCDYCRWRHHGRGHRIFPAPARPLGDSARARIW